MGGIVERGVSVDTKASPRHVAIEKAQEELRQEYDVREERRRELEFLEKGGNPLDFKLSHVASLSVQSTSLTDQIAEQNVMSEAKGSVACAASPHGDSVESSGKPGSSLCRETNTADNLMLLDGENSNIGGEKIVKCGTKRTNATQPEQSVHTDDKNTAKEAEDSGLLRVGVKSQAYARRNRSKSSRESANIASIRSPGVLVDSQRKDAKGVTREPQAEDHGVSSISNSKPTSSNCTSMPKKAASDDLVAMEIEGIQTIHEDNEALKNEAGEGENRKKAPERPSSIVDNNQQLNGGGGMAAGGASAESPDAMTKLQSSLFTCNETSRETCAPEKAANGHSDRSMVDVHADDLDNKSAIPHCAVEAPSYNKHEMNLPCVDINRTTNEHPEGNENVALVKGDGRSDEDPHGLKPFDKDVKESGQLEDVSIPIIEDKSNSMHRQVSNDVHVKDEMEVCGGKGDTRKDTGQLASSNHEKVNNKASLDLERRKNSSGDSSSVDKLVSVTGASALPTKDAPNSVPSVKPFTHNLENEIQKSGGNQTKMAKKEYEDSILRKARLIEINLKRASERSLCNISLEKRQKCHWDFVLEEMAWMANDFMQERLWKSTAAAQVCHWIAPGGLAKFEEATCRRKQKTVARNLAKAIMDFWRSAQTLRTSGETVMQECYSNMLEETKLVGVKANKEQGNETLEEEKCRRPRQSPIQNYALRFLEYNCNVSECLVLAEAPSTPDRLNDFGILKVPHHLSEESLFYTVAPGAMLAYRESVECLFVYHKKVCNTGRENDCEASMCDSIADVPRDNAYEADEGETSTYLLAGTYDGGLSSKLGHRKKRLMQQRMNGTRLYEVGSDVPYEPCLESKPGNQSLLSNGKRHSTFLAIPTKRIRTASRQRVVSPFPAAIVGTHQVTSKTDVSSGDTNSYQDDQSSLHGGSLPRKNIDIESTVDFDRKWPYDGSEASTKYKKKKKPKHPVYKTQQSAVDACALMAAVKVAAYDQRPKVDLIAQYDQKDYLKKRSESQQFDSNVVNGQHASKKPKLMKQAPDILQEALTPVGPMASPVASQMSNMANPSKIIKIITNRDRGRKSKALKMGAGHSGSGSPWSNFEDQALVVLVHDMGQNWELVSDAMNSIVQFKCIYRKPKECKDRHKFLMDKSSGDGADSADDSGSSQHYQSILPGIPKGSARQLFQRLQGPFEEETLKAHFEKIIFLGQHLHSTRKQGDSQEHKQNTPAHSSHVVVLSQACPNNLSGGILMPLDLCDAIASNTDALSLGYPGSHTNGLTLPNYHGSIGTVLPTSNLNSRLPGSPGILGSNLPSSSTLNTPSRDAQRFGAPRPTSLQGDEQQRIQYNQMLSGRNPQQPGVSVPGALPAGVDRGVRMMPCAHGMGMLTGLNRGMPVAKPGFTRINSPGMLNMVSSGNVLPNSGPGMQNAVNVHPGAISGPGTSMLRPREPTQMLRPGQNLEEHRQMMMQEFQMQVSQANSQAVHFSSMNPPFSNAAVSPVQSFPVQQPQQTHQMPQHPHMFGNSNIQGTNHSSPQQQAYAMRLAKERHIQQCMMSQQQHPFSGASVVPTVQNGSQIQPQSQSPAATVVSTQPQHKQQHSTQNPPDGSALPNQPAGTPQHKQKKQQSQQQSRQNQQQKNQGSQQAKLMKSLGRGNMSMHQSHPVDSTQASSNSATSKNQVFDKNQMQQGPGLFPGSKGFIPSVPQPGNQAKIYNSPLAQSPTQSPDIGNQGAVQGSPSQTLLASQQSPLPSSSPLATQQQQQQRYINSSQNNIQRMMMQQNRQMNSDGRTESHIDHVQHNQMIPTTSIPESTDSGSPGVSSINQRKQEPSHDPAAASSTSLLASSPQDTFVGNETSLTSTSQGMLQRQIPGGVPMHGHGIGSQWQQQQSRQQQPQHQQRPVVQGTVYAHPSNSGPG